MILDGDQLLEVPYVGNRLRKQNEGTPSARGMDPSITFTILWNSTTAILFVTPVDIY